MLRSVLTLMFIQGNTLSDKAHIFQIFQAHLIKHVCFYTEYLTTPFYIGYNSPWESPTPPTTTLHLMPFAYQNCNRCMSSIFVIFRCVFYEWIQMVFLKANCAWLFEFGDNLLNCPYCPYCSKYVHKQGVLFWRTIQRLIKLTGKFWRKTFDLTRRPPQQT